MKNIYCSTQRRYYSGRFINAGLAGVRHEGNK